MATKKTAGKSNSTATSAVAPTDQAGQLRLMIDDEETPLLYSTTVRVWHSPEEINLDFAGPIRPNREQKTARLRVDQRVVLNPWAAKRLALALNQAMARYEQTYGLLELDERKRRKNSAPKRS